MKKPFNKWPLAVSTFTLRDKLKVAKWIISQDHYTMGENVSRLEERFSDLSGMNALAVSSGSAANHLLFELWKVRNPGKSAIVICPAVTWISAISPAIMAGFDVKFCDVNKIDLSLNYDALREILLKLRRNTRKRVIIWPTALIGYIPNMDLLGALAKEFHAELFMDCCENTLSRTKHGASILASCPVTTTSCYFAHQVQAIEMGFVFFRSKEDYQLGRMLRNHGMVRSLTDEKMQRDTCHANWHVDPKFLFAVAGTNWRPSDLNAMFGLCDFDRIRESEQHRQVLYSFYRSQIERSAYFNPPVQEGQSIFCLPVFNTDSHTEQIKKQLNAEGVETRPIVGGNLLRQPCLSHYGEPRDFPNAEFIHRCGFYVGLGRHVSINMVEWLCNFLRAQK